MEGGDGVDQLDRSTRGPDVRDCFLESRRDQAVAVHRNVHDIALEGTEDT